ncbi:MAG: DUF5659 domain-containing protein [Patescibacteria group bacterium]
MTQLPRQNFQTTDMYLAVYLLAKGHPLLNVTDEQHRKAFHFPNTDEVNIIAKAFFDAADNDTILLVPVRKLFMNLTRLKNKIHQGIY